VAPEDGFRLKDYLAIPFSLETIDSFVFAEVTECEILGIGRWREGDLHYARLGGRRTEAAMGGSESAESRRIVGEERVDGGKEVCKAYLGYK
jgi:hypothetical protein